MQRTRDSRFPARRPRFPPPPFGPPAPRVPEARLSLPHRPPATSSGCSCGSPPPTRAAPTRARRLEPAPGLGSSGSSVAGRTRKEAKPGGGGHPRQPYPDPPPSPSRPRGSAGSTAALLAPAENLSSGSRTPAAQP